MLGHVACESRFMEDPAGTKWGGAGECLILHHLGAPIRALSLESRGAPRRGRALPSPGAAL